jgi:hypothetical protein
VIVSPAELIFVEARSTTATEWPMTLWPLLGPTVTAPGAYCEQTTESDQTRLRVSRPVKVFRWR